MERFEQEKNVVKNQLGINLLDKFMESYPKYGEISTDMQTEIKSKAFDARMTPVFLRGSDQSVYGEWIKDYRKDFANNKDKYPKSVRGVIDVMRQLTPKKKKRDDKNNNNRNGEGNDGKGNENQKDKKAREASFFQNNKSVCWCCGRPGCNSLNFPKKDDIARNKWHDRTVIMH